MFIEFEPMMSLLAFGTGVLFGGWAARTWLSGDLRRPFRSPGSREVESAPVSLTLTSGVRLHGIQTGLLAVKRAHAELTGPAALRLGSIILDSCWTPLLPILAWVIEHPEGLILVDTGERAAASDLSSYLACDPANRWFFLRNLPIFVTAAEELPVQMRTLGLSPERVTRVVLTHLHQDHTGGLAFFPQAEFMVSRDEYQGHLQRPMGAVRRLWPEHFRPRLLEPDGPPLGPFPSSTALTRAGDVLIVPTPGHSYGHQSVVVRDGALSYFLAGDLAFSQDALRARQLQGIASDLAQARQSMNQTLEFLSCSPSVFLPSHDPGSLSRLRERAFFSA